MLYSFGGLIRRDLSLDDDIVISGTTTDLPITVTSVDNAFSGTTTDLPITVSVT